MINFAILGSQNNRTNFINQTCDIFKIELDYLQETNIIYFPKVKIDYDKVSYRLIDLPDDMANISASYLDNLILQYELNHAVFIIDINELCSDNVGGNIIKMASELRNIRKYDRFIQFVFITDRDSIPNSNIISNKSWKNTLLGYFNMEPSNTPATNPLSIVLKFFNKFSHIDYPLYDRDFYPWEDIIVLYANMNAWRKMN